ncbi:hypothetical protein J3F84DRAFT_355308 [Trichoderma pleuroticola]
MYYEYEPEKGQKCYQGAQHRGNAAAFGRARRTWPMPCHHLWASLCCLSLSFSFSPF